MNSPSNLKRSFLVATGALKMDIPCLFIVPIRAPDLNNAQHKPTAPLLYAKNNAVKTKNWNEYQIK